MFWGTFHKMWLFLHNNNMLLKFTDLLNVLLLKTDNFSNTKQSFFFRFK